MPLQRFDRVFRLGIVFGNLQSEFVHASSQDEFVQRANLASPAESSNGAGRCLRNTSGDSGDIFFLVFRQLDQCLVRDLVNDSRAEQCWR